VPHQQLALVQLALATAVAECTRLTQQQEATAAGALDEDRCTVEPTAKRQCLAQQQQQQQQQERAGQEQGATRNSTGASMQAKQVGLQLLTAVCCCEVLQHNSRQLIAAAAVTAAATVAGGGEQAVCALQCSTWLYRYLCLQVTAPAAVPAAAATVVGGVSSAAGLQDAAAAAGLQAPAALAQLLQQLSSQDPTLVLQLVHIVMGTAAPAAGASQQAAAAATVSSNAGAGTAHVGFGDKFKQLLAAAAKQWRPLPDAACQGKKQQKGRKAGQAKQGQQQQHQSGMAGAVTAAQQAPPVPIQQVMPDAPNVSATWVCRHIVPVLLQQAQEQQQALAAHQQQQQAASQPASLQTAADAGAAKHPPAVVALAHLLAADGLLLPAAGEVLVSARYAAEALNAAPIRLQEAVAAAWRQQLEQRHAQQHCQDSGPAAMAAVSLAARQQQQQQAAAASELVPWKVLQPMLCLLSHLEQGAPTAQFLASCVHGCISSACGGNSSASNSRAQDVLQHILLPVRFGIKMPGRLWLLQQLLTAGSTQQHALASAPGAAVPGGDRAAVAVLDNLEQLLQGEAQQQLAEGLQLLAKRPQNNLQQQQQQQGGAGGKAGAAGTGSSKTAAAASTGLSLQQTQALDLAAGLVQLAGTLGACGGSSPVGLRDTSNAGAEAAVDVRDGWQQQVAKRLWEELQAAAVAAACEMLPRPW
jgi:hypothetical protein